MKQLTSPQIRRSTEQPETFISEQCFIREWSNDPADPEVSIAHARVPVGVTTRWHRLESVSERYVILSGQGRVELADDLNSQVAAGDVVLIPPGCAQRIVNTGEQNLCFLAICSPRFTPDCYQDIETSK